MMYYVLPPCPRSKPAEGPGASELGSSFRLEPAEWRPPEPAERRRHSETMRWSYRIEPAERHQYLRGDVVLRHTPAERLVSDHGQIAHQFESPRTGVVVPTERWPLSSPRRGIVSPRQRDRGNRHEPAEWAYRLRAAFALSSSVRSAPAERPRCSEKDEGAQAPTERHRISDGPLPFEPRRLHCCQKRPRRGLVPPMIPLEQSPRRGEQSPTVCTSQTSTTRKSGAGVQPHCTLRALCPPRAANPGSKSNWPIRLSGASTCGS